MVYQKYQYMYCLYIVLSEMYKDMHDVHSIELEKESIV